MGRTALINSAQENLYETQVLSPAGSNATLRLVPFDYGELAAETWFLIELVEPAAAHWDEERLDWHSRPPTAPVAAVPFLGDGRPGEPLEIDITPLVEACLARGGGRALSLRLRSSVSGDNRFINFVSRERHAVLGPALILAIPAGPADPR